MWLRRLIMKNEIKMNEYGLQNNNDKLSYFDEVWVYSRDILCVNGFSHVENFEKSFWEV